MLLGEHGQNRPLMPERTQTLACSPPRSHGGGEWGVVLGVVADTQPVMTALRVHGCSGCFQGQGQVLSLLLSGRVRAGAEEGDSGPPPGSHEPELNSSAALKVSHPKELRTESQNPGTNNGP